MAQTNDGQLNQRQRLLRALVMVALLVLIVAGNYLLFGQRKPVSPALWLPISVGYLFVLVLALFYRRTLSPAQRRRERVRYNRNIYRAFPIRVAFLVALVIAIFITGLLARQWILIAAAPVFGIVLILLALWQRRSAAKRLSQLQDPIES